MKPGSAVEMPGAWKTRKTEPSFPFVSHSPWKSLRDCHIPTAPAMAVFLIGKRNPKTKKGAQPERELELHPFRLILGLENAIPELVGRFLKASCAARALETRTDRWLPQSA